MLAWDKSLLIKYNALKMIKGALLHFLAILGVLVPVRRNKGCELFFTPFRLSMLSYPRSVTPFLCHSYQTHIFAFACGGNGE